MRLYNLRVGDILIADDNHSCLTPGERCRVQQTYEGELYVECNYGIHLLENNVHDDDSLDGFTLAKDTERG